MKKVNSTLKAKITAIALAAVTAVSTGTMIAAPISAEGSMFAITAYAAEEKKDSAWDTSDKVVKYTTKGLSFVGGDAEKIGKYGENIYNLVKSTANLDISGIYKNGKSFLKLLGIIKTKTAKAEPSLTLEDVNQNISELRALTQHMSEELHLTQQQAYRNGLQSFDNSVLALYTYCSSVQGMYVDAAADLADLGIEEPGEEATGEELFAYNKTMIDYITAQEMVNNRKYKNFTFYMGKIEANFNEAAGEVAKKQDQSPLTCYDNYVNSFFNWDTQGWYARQAYRSNVEFALKTSYAQLAVYYNIGSEETKLRSGEDAHAVLTKNMSKALNTMAENDAGMSPDKLSNGRCAYSFTLGIKGCSFALNSNGNTGVSSDQIQNYVSRLHGRTVLEDLELAGFYNCFHWRCLESKYPDGIGFEKNEDNVYVLSWDGKITQMKKDFSYGKIICK